MSRPLEDIEQETEETSAKLTLEEKKALLREAKRKYGSDWKRSLGMVGRGMGRGMGRMNVKDNTDWESMRFNLKR